MIPPLHAPVIAAAEWVGLAVTAAAWPVLLAQEAAPDEEPDFFVRLISNQLILPIGLLLIFYLTFIGPERRRKAEEAKMMSALKKNDRVVTVGGIHGTIVAAGTDNDVVTLRIDEGSNTRIKVNRSAIAKIVSAEKEKEKEKETAKGSEGES